MAQRAGQTLGCLASQLCMDGDDTKGGLRPKPSASGKAFVVVDADGLSVGGERVWESPRGHDCEKSWKLDQGLYPFLLARTETSPPRRPTLHGL